MLTTLLLTVTLSAKAPRFDHRATPPPPKPPARKIAIECRWALVDPVASSTTTSFREIDGVWQPR